jgi:hypothetical protein
MKRLQNSATDYCHGCGAQLDDQIIHDFETGHHYCRKVECIIAGLRKDDNPDDDILQMIMCGTVGMVEAELSALRESGRIA